MLSVRVGALLNLAFRKIYNENITFLTEEKEIDDLKDDVKMKKTTPWQCRRRVYERFNILTAFLA